MKYRVDPKAVADLANKIARRTAEYTARDVKSAAARSMKSGGKNRRSKNYKHSKPGDPPLYHTGGIKKAIAFEETKDGYIVGPEARGTSKALKTLEKGGTGTFSTTVYSKEYEATLHRRASSYCLTGRRRRRLSTDTFTQRTHGREPFRRRVSSIGRKTRNGRRSRT